MKKRIMLPLLASFGLVASAPVTVPAAENSARIDRMVAQSVKDCSRATHIPNYAVQLRGVFMTQQPKAIAQMERRGVTICLDDRHEPFAASVSDRHTLRYMRAWDNFTLPATANYAERPRLFNVIADESRDTVIERLGYVLGNAWNGTGADARQREYAQREGARVRTEQAARTEAGQVAITVRAMTGH